MTKKYLAVIAGPTAVGKTSFSIDLAEQYKTEIISADSRQVYNEFKIGTSPPSGEDRERVPHHFIQSHSIFDPITAGDYEREALSVIQNLFERHRLLLLVGGSGMYIKALCEGLDSFPKVSEETKRKVQKNYEERGIAYLQDYLQSEDPEYFREVDLNNTQRLLRAVHVIETSGKPFSAFRQHEAASRPFTTLYFALHRSREILYQRINQRVDRMIEQGLIEEARTLYPHRSHRTLQTVGYKELFDYFERNCSLEDAVERIKRNTRRYAKRQLTWFRNDDHYSFFHPEKDKDEIYNTIASRLSR